MISGDLKPLSLYWSGRAGSAGSAPSLVLHREAVRPHHQGLEPNSVRFPTALREMIRHRGVAARLLLVMLYEQQLDHAHVRKEWIASPTPDRRFWKDVLVRGRLATPSWATLTLGYEPEPMPATAWRRSRSDAVKKGFARLDELGLYDLATHTLQMEDRPWQWDIRVVDRRYVSNRRSGPDVFRVPSWLLTSGAYAALTGAGLYVALAAYEYQQATSAEPPFHHQGLRWDTFDAGAADLLRWRLPADLATAVAQLRRAREVHDAIFQVRREALLDIKRWQVREIARQALDGEIVLPVPTGVIPAKKGLRKVVSVEDVPPRRAPEM